MVIHEVKFTGSGKDVSAYFSSKSKADMFIAANATHINVVSRLIHTIEKNKQQIIKFLNRENGIG